MNYYNKLERHAKNFLALGISMLFAVGIRLQSVRLMVVHKRARKQWLNLPLFLMN